MKCREIIENTEKSYPRNYAMEWDNVGLLAGNHEKEVRRIYVALDATDEVIEAAKAAGADLLVTHHPMIFSPVSRITDEDFIGRRLLRLIQADMAYYAMHTNFDILGMADLSADYLRLTDREVLSVTAETQEGQDGFGRVGELPRKMSLKECGEFVKNALSLNDVKIYGDPDTQVEKAAICTGSGKSMISDVLAKGAQVYVTGDIDHHTGIDAVAQGLTIVDAGHYGTEYIFMKAMEKVLKEQYPNLQITCAKVQSPYMIL